MKKVLFLTLLFVVLGAGAWYSYRKANRKSTLEKLDLNFSVTDTASVDRIIIEPIEGQKADLLRDKAGIWMINGKYKAAPVLMDVLLTTIRNVEMLRPLSPNEVATARESFEKRGRKVSIFVNGELYKTYLLGDDAAGNKGTYLQLEGGDPYVAYLRGFNGFLSPRYDVTENEWRDRLLFSCQPSQIKSLKLLYARMPAENVELTISDSRLQLAGATYFDSAAAFQMISSFRRVYAERYLDRFPAKQKDSLLKAGSEYTIELTGNERECSARLMLFFTSDPDRSLAHIPERGEWLTIQNRGLYPILQRKSSLLNR